MAGMLTILLLLQAVTCCREVIWGWVAGRSTPIQPPGAIWLGSCPSKCSQQASDSSFNISRKHFYTMGRRRRPMAARSAARRRRRPPGATRRPVRPPEILISSKPSNTDLQKQGYTLHGTGSIRVDGFSTPCNHKNTNSSREWHRNQENHKIASWAPPGAVLGGILAQFWTPGGSMGATWAEKCAPESVPKKIQ